VTPPTKPYGQLIAAVPLVYILCTLQTPKIGIDNISCLQLLNHLWLTAYATITPTELDHMNLVTMKLPWTTEHPDPIETVFTQLEDGMVFAEVRHNFTTTPVLRMGTIIEATSLFTSSCRDWRAKQPTKKTMASFQTHFPAATSIAA
jgi:hypothetical protein